MMSGNFAVAVSNTTAQSATVTITQGATTVATQAVASGAWEQVTEHFFQMPVHYRDFADFELRMVAVTYLNHRLDGPTRAAVRERFEPHMSDTGAHFLRPMRVNLLRRR